MDFETPPPDPLPVFRQWLLDAETTGLPNPNAMTVATIDPDGRPASRVVLLRRFDERGAVFFTNRRSRKGLALAVHPHAALGFHWDPIDRQVRIEGEVEVTSDEESDEYFAQRPRESQINAWASSQSQPVTSRAALRELQSQMTERFDGQLVPRPPHWGGYRVALCRIEFWQGDPHRFHDRIVYLVGDDGAWKTVRLCP